MPLKLAVIVLPPLSVSIVVLRVAGVPWDTTGIVAAVLVVFLLLIGLCDRLGRRTSPWRQQQQAAAAAESTPQDAALGLGASAIAGLPAYKYDKCGGGDECSVCLGEIKPKETVKQLPVCTHLFHEGCIDVWLRSHRTCPLCRTPVDAPAVQPPDVELLVLSQIN